MYQLYHSEERCELVIEPLKLCIRKKNIEDGKVYYFNDCYFICSDRKVLQEKAKSLKLAWTMRASDRLEKLTNMKVRNKYK